MCFKNRNRNYPTETTVSHTWSQSLLRSKMDRQFLKITEKKLEKQKNKAYFFFFFLITELKWTSVRLYVTSATYKLRELLVDLRNPCRTQACPESSRQKYILEECNGCLGNCHTISIQSIVLDICGNVLHHCLRFFRKCITHDRQWCHAFTSVLFWFSLSS